MVLTYTTWPLALLAIGSVLIYFMARIIRPPNHTLALFTTLILLTALTMVALPQITTGQAGTFIGQPQNSHDALQYNAGGQLLAGMALLLAALVSIYCGEYLNLDRRFHVFYPLLLLMMTGLTGMVFSVDLFSVYLFCELMSICAYALVAFRKDTDTAIEAGYKYLIMGSAATIMMLLGIALVFFESGSVELANIQGQATSWSEVGIICLFVGLGLKCAMVPMHTWLPDAHGRAPSSISAMLSGILVQSVLFTLVKVCLGLGTDRILLGTALLVIAGANIILGNVMALVQQHTKRLLGYSTIAQMGYMMLCLGIGLRSGSVLALRAFFFLLVIHAFSKALAFLSKGSFHYYLGATHISDLKGKAYQSSTAAWVFSLSLASLSGLPPLAGFTGKWFLLTSLIEQLDQLGIAAMVVFLSGSVIALGYYLPLIVTMFQASSHQHPPPNPQIAKVEFSLWMSGPMVFLGICILLMSLFPQFFLQFTDGAVGYLLGMIME